jgi:hypothetical protein
MIRWLYTLPLNLDWTGIYEKVRTREPIGEWVVGVDH